MSIFTSRSPGGRTKTVDWEKPAVFPDETTPEQEPADQDSEVGQEPAVEAGEDGPAEPGTGGRRARVSRVITVLACVLVLFALLVPNKIGKLNPGAFVRIPIEGVLGAGLFVLLAAKPRRLVAAAGGALLGLLLIVKFLDMGFYSVLVRPWDPVLDWTFLNSGLTFVTGAYGTAGGIAVVAGVVLLAIGLVVLMSMATVRVSGFVARHPDKTKRGVAVSWAIWSVAVVTGLSLVPGVPVASDGTAKLAYTRVLKVGDGLRDQRRFAKQAGVDAFRNTPPSQMLTGLRGKDVLLTFIESYGRSAVEDPKYAPQVDAVLTAGSERLRKAGLHTKSAWLKSSTAGGGSWLAHSTLLSGLWINNQQRYHNLVSSDRLTLSRAFKGAGWRTASFMPANFRAWPEGTFYGYDKVYDQRNMGYRGPRFGFPSMPDQYTLSVIQRERDRTQGPLMVETGLLSSHWPWASIPKGLVDWNTIGDGSQPWKGQGAPDGSRPKDWQGGYRQSIEYSLSTVISYAEKYADKDLVLVFLGDHQPIPLITGDGAGRDVPITIVARDPKVLDKVASWGWQDGLKPGAKAPLWRMDQFRDRFLTAFGSTPSLPAR